MSFNEFCELFSTPLSVEVNSEFVRFVSVHGYTHIFLPSEFFRYCSVATILALKDSGVLIAGVMGDDENNFIETIIWAFFPIQLLIIINNLIVIRNWQVTPCYCR